MDKEEIKELTTKLFEVLKQIPTVINILPQTDWDQILDIWDQILIKRITQMIVKENNLILNELTEEITNLKKERENQ